MAPRPDLVVLANPRAGSGRVGRHLPEVLETLRAAGASVEVLTADHSVDTIVAARRAVESGVRALVAAGGDGTVHLAVQALAKTGVPLGVVPLGTGNDLVDALGLPADPLVAARALVADLEVGVAMTIDAVRAVRRPPGGAVHPGHHHSGGDSGAVHAGHGPHWYVAILSVGFDSAVNARANRARWPRGRRRYDLAILAELARLRSYPVALELDGVRVETPALLVAVGNTRSYGGGLRMCPDADPTDGLLDVTLVEPISRYELLRVKPRLYTGTHVTHPSVRTYRARRVTIDAPGADAAYADGEPFLLLALELECVPGALRVLGFPRSHLSG